MGQSRIIVAATTIVVQIGVPVKQVTCVEVVGLGDGSGDRVVLLPLATIPVLGFVDLPVGQVVAAGEGLASIIADGHGGAQACPERSRREVAVDVVEAAVHAGGHPLAVGVQRPLKAIAAPSGPKCFLTSF
jgi:hypothetical protein